MKLIYSSLLVIWFTGILNNSIAQRTTNEYIVMDSSYSMGKVLPLGKGRVQFQRTKKEKPVVYSANEVREYGYEGWVYESLLINGEKKYLKKIVSGKVILYQDKKQYALKMDSTLTLFNKKNYRLVIGESITCEGNDRTLSKLTYSNEGLRNFMEAYNHNACNLDNLAYRKIGGYVGYNFLQFNAFFIGNSLNLTDNYSVPTVGLFCDLPLYRPRSLYLTTELNWLYGKPLFYNESQSKTNFLGLTVNGINSLIGIKWVLGQKSIQPYLKTGALVSFVSITSPTGLVETVSNGSVINTSQQAVSNSNALLYGFNSGIGFEIPFKNRHKIHFEIKYLKTFDRNFNSYRMNFSGLSIIMGFNI